MGVIPIRRTAAQAGIFINCRSIKDPRFRGDDLGTKDPRFRGDDLGTEDTRLRGDDPGPSCAGI
jgi:hypothetical protein